MKEAPFTVDAIATAAIYATLPLGLGCACGDCRFAEQHLDRLVPPEVAERLAAFGVDARKPLELTSIVDPDGTGLMARLMYEVVGTLNIQDLVDAHGTIRPAHVEHVGSVSLQYSTTGFVREPFKASHVFWIQFNAPLDTLNGLSQAD